MVVNEYLKSIDNENKKDVFLSSLLYPKTKSMKDTPIYEIFYNCKKNVCDFKNVKLQINENTNLLSYDITKIAQTLVNQIEQNPEEFNPHKLDGYQINRNNIPILRLRRENDINDDIINRIGLIEYNALYSRAMQLISQVKNESILKIASNIIDRIYK